MVYIPSMRNLVAESESEEWHKTERLQLKPRQGFKSILEMIDTLTIKCTSPTIILEMDWVKFNELFGGHEHVKCGTKVVPDYINPKRSSLKQRRKSKVNVCMLRTMMETNLKDYLENLPILKGISYSKLETIAQMCKYKVAQKGDTICSEGDVEDEVYVLLTGTAKVQALASIGMAEMLKDKQSALSDDYKITLEKNKSSGGTGTTQPSDFIDHCHRTMVEVGSKAQREWTRRNPLRKSVGTIINQLESGDFDEDLIYINEETWTELDRTHTVDLGELGPGQYFGEMATFIDLPRAATITASEACLMVSLSKYDFRNLYRSVYPDMKPSVECLVKRHMMSNIFNLKCPFLSGDPREREEMIDRFANCATIVRLSAGEVVFHENDDKADHFYFVYHGALVAERTIKGQLRKIGVLFPGNYFGEVALINKSARLATITSCMQSVLLAMVSGDFHQCFQDCPELLAELIVRMKGRGLDLLSALNHREVRCLFSKHLESEHGMENLTFYDAVSKFKKSFENLSVSERESESQTIIEQYLAENAPDLVNVSGNMFQEIRSKAAGRNISAEMFDDCQKEIYKLLQSDPFARFKRTSKFDDVLQKLKSYDVLESSLVFD